MPLHTWSFPLWLSGKESACNVGDTRFDPWVGKIPWRRAWQSTPVFLPGESHEERSLAGYSPQDHKELEKTRLSDLAQMYRSIPSFPSSLPPPLSEPSSPSNNGLLTLLPAYCLQTILTPLAEDIAKILLQLSFLFFLWFTEQRLQDNDLQGNSLTSILGCLQVHQLTVHHPSAQKHWLEQVFSYTYYIENKLPQIFAAPADSKWSLSIPSLIWGDPVI